MDMIRRLIRYLRYGSLDTRIRNDAVAGRLDWLKDEAKAEHAAGRTTDLFDPKRGRDEKS